MTGGRSGIRTHERVAPLPVFKTGALNRSAIRPRADLPEFSSGRKLLHRTSSSPPSRPFAAASACMLGIRWLFMSTVIAIEECPSLSCTTWDARFLPTDGWRGCVDCTPTGAKWLEPSNIQAAREWAAFLSDQRSSPMIQKAQISRAAISVIPTPIPSVLMVMSASRPERAVDNRFSILRQ